MPGSGLHAAGKVSLPTGSPVLAPEATASVSVRQVRLHRLLRRNGWGGARPRRRDVRVTPCGRRGLERHLPGKGASKAALHLVPSVRLAWTSRWFRNVPLERSGVEPVHQPTPVGGGVGAVSCCCVSGLGQGRTSESRSLG
ncbi:hypothetical protein HJG60_008524 [Phyllostomus discolor]|uniref:Uncharacterized protein n=1 Tax=Phyllostomus discolor TaxID=89673 RepID=A0A833Z3L4_9CHIR|nr:hypothetical protein HJG60_008524 [Phyllostomus discolor]